MIDQHDWNLIVTVFAETRAAANYAGGRLHDWRVERKAPLRLIAEMSGISAPDLSRIERGQRHPTDDELARLRAALDHPSLLQPVRHLQAVPALPTDSTCKQSSSLQVPDTDA